jgi:hypothetical protein
VGLTFARALSERWAVRARVAYSRYDYDGQYVYDFAEEGEDPDLVLNRDYWKGRWWEGEFQVTGSPIVGHTMTAGDRGAVQRATGSGQLGPGDQPRRLPSQPQLGRLRPGTSSNTWRRMTFVGRQRYDEYSTFGHDANPRLALIYDLLEEHDVETLLRHCVPCAERLRAVLITWRRHPEAQQ